MTSDPAERAGVDDADPRAETRGQDRAARASADVAGRRSPELLGEEAEQARAARERNDQLEIEEDG